MKNTNKKGFTIVELVIVIAVVAILAAVLIPTFVGIVKNANVSADTQLAKNLNTAITMAEAEGAKMDTFNDVLLALRNGGYIVSNLNPTAEGFYFVWESSSNQILLVDSNNGYSIAYQSKELTNNVPGNTWWFAVTDPTLIETLKSNTACDEINVFYAPKTAEDLSAALEEVLNNAEGEQSVVVSDSIVMSGDKNFNMDNKDAKVVIDLGGNTVSAENYGGDIPFNVVYGDLTLQGGTVTAVGAGGNTINGGKGNFMLYVGAKSTYDEGSSATIEDVKFEAVASAAVVADMCATLDMSNSTINITNGVGFEAASGAQAVLENVTINQSGENENKLGTCVGVGNHGSPTGVESLVTIKSGEYNARGYAVQCFASGGKVVIEGGTFKKVAGSSHKYLFKVDTLNTSQGHTPGSIVIKGGTFEVNGTMKPFSSMTAEDWAIIVSGTVAGVGTDTVTITAG